MTTSLKQKALAIFQAGLDAADPFLAVTHVLSYTEDGLQIRLDPSDPARVRNGLWSKIQITAIGKAACRMAEAACAIIPADIWAGSPLVITNYENAHAAVAIEVIGAGHPIPDEAGLGAARKTVERLQALGPDNLVLILLSGGGSALLPYPAAGITLAEKRATTDLLLASGATINEINCVRKHLSAIKGGRLAEITPAALHTLILSDVLGDEPSAIASGPTVPDPTTFADAVAVCHAKTIWGKLPDAVRCHLEKGAAGLLSETPKPDDPVFQKSAWTLAGSNVVSIAALEGKSLELGYRTYLYSAKLCGEAQQAAAEWASAACRLAAENRGQALAMIAGGETTVTLTGNGKGGRNQELALAFAVAADQIKLPGRWAFLSAGSDGRDGPTDAAGGLVDQDTVKCLRESAIIPVDMLANHNSYRALEASGDLLMTGPTGTNIADLQVLLLHP